MKNSFNKKQEVYKIVKYQTKLLNANSQEQQDLYKYKLNEHMNNLSNCGLSKETRQKIMSGGTFNIDEIDFENEKHIELMMEEIERQKKETVAPTKESLERLAQKTEKIVYWSFVVWSVFAVYGIYSFIKLFL